MVREKAKTVPESSGFSGLLYRYWPVIFIYAYVIVICRAMAACYRIDGFSYLYVTMLYVSGILLFALSRRPPALLAVSLFLLLPAIYKYRLLKTLWDIHIVQNFNSINLAIYNGTETHFNQFLPFLIFLIPLTAAVCIAFSAKGAFVPVLCILSMYMFSFWNNGLDWMISGHVPAFVMLSVLYYGISRYTVTEKKYKNSDTGVMVSFRNILLYSLILSVSVTLLTSAAVHVSGVSSLVQLKRNYDLRKLHLEDASKKNSFNLTGGIYGGDPKRLGGPIRLNTLIALKVKAERPVYLRGSIMDYYDGQSWSKSFDNFEIKSIGPLFEPSPGFMLLMTGSPDRKPRMEKMTIHHYGLATSTLFAPNNSAVISTKDGKIMRDSSGMLMLVGKGAAGRSYTIKYFRSDTGIELFNWAAGSKPGINYAAGSLQPYKHYLQVPESVTPRTYELVEALTKNCRTDGEKAARILNYLTASFPYSLEVSRVPEGEDFVDYFLFTEKKGYCTYFASAAAIMCRIAGIPARYVEGFNMDEERDSSGLYIVRNHRAHAWTEILVSPENNFWSIADCVPQGASTADISASVQYRDKFDDDRYKSGDNRFPEAGASKYAGDLVDYAALMLLLLYPLFIIPAAAALLLAVYIIFRLAAFNRKVAKYLKEESAIPLYRHIAARLEAMGEGIPSNCCELEYIKSLKDREMSAQLEKLAKACYAESYGGIKELAALDKKACYRSIERRLRKKSGFIKYWYRRIR